MGGEVKPRIWFTQIHSSNYSPDLSLHARPGEEVPYIRVFEQRQPYVPADLDFVPTIITPTKETARLKRDTGDSFRISGGLVVISKKFRDVLVDFDLGETSLIELEWRGWRDAPEERPPYYLFPCRGRQANADSAKVKGD